MENQTQKELDLGALSGLIDDVDFGEEQPNTEEEDFSVEDLNKEEEEAPKPKEEEETPEPEKKEEEKETPEEEPEKTSYEGADYTELAKDLLESGEWEDVIIEDEDGNEIKLSEMEKVDKSTFLSVKKDFDKENKEKLNKDYIHVANVDENKRKLVNAILNGNRGEVEDLLRQEPDLVEEPFAKYDSTNDSHNEQVLAWYYANKGHDRDEVDALINKAKEDLTLDSKASKVVETAKEGYKKRIEEKEKQVLQDREEEIKALKEYKKDLSEKFKELGVKDTTLRKFTDFATKANENGDLPVDEMYEEWMKDPDKAKDLIYFMLEKDDYIKKQTEQMRRDLSIDTLRKVKRVSDNQKTGKKKPEEEDKGTKTEDWLEQLEFEDN